MQKRIDSYVFAENFILLTGGPEYAGGRVVLLYIPAGFPVDGSCFCAGGIILVGIPDIHAKAAIWLKNFFYWELNKYFNAFLTDFTGAAKG